jgi:hypothetical protein
MLPGRSGEAPGIFGKVLPDLPTGLCNPLNSGRGKTQIEMSYLFIAHSFSADAYSSAQMADRVDPPCAPAKCVEIDDHSGQAEIRCLNTSAYNYAKLITAVVAQVSADKFEVGKCGRVTYDDSNDKTVTLSFDPYGGMKNEGRVSILFFSGMKQD